MAIKNKPTTTQINVFSCPKNGINYWIICLLLAITNLVNGQVVDNFEDKDLMLNPTWHGDLVKFQSLNGQLVSNSKIANDRFYISTPSSRLVKTQWQFDLNLAFNTSSVNYVDVFLSSDSAILTGLNSGYFMRIGGTEDEISLYKKSGATQIEILDGKNGKTDHSFNALKIKVIYDSLGFFNLWVDTTGTGISYLLEGRVKEDVLANGKYFGLVVRQSTTGFFQKHSIDNIYLGPILTDTIPPRVTRLEVLHQDTLLLQFSEKIRRPLSLQTMEINYSIGNPVILETVNGDSSLWKLSLAKSLEAYKYYALFLKNLQDPLGNTLNDTQLYFRWVPVFAPKRHEILLTEWLPDPDPEILLPNEEFIEILNTSDHALQLNNCRVDDGSNIAYLPQIVLEKDSFLILCRAGAEGKFQGFGNVVGLKGFPSLNNTQDIINLRNAEGELIHRVVYDLQSYQDAFKSQGGWSIEMIDPNNPCAKLNYRASNHSNGGTPGKVNSVWGLNPDHVKPFITKVKMKESSLVSIEFNEELDSISAVREDNFLQSELPFLRSSLNQNVIDIHLIRPPETGKLYTLQVKNISDCVENILNDTIVQFAVPEMVRKGDVLISEILFNPPSGGVDFVELFNASDKILTLKSLSLFNLSETQTPETIILLDTSGELFFPKTFKVLCTDPEWVRANFYHHDASAFVKLNSFVPMDDDKGHIGISVNGGVILDEIKYTEHMHWPLLTVKEGVSLERISFEMKMDEGSNATSAAASYGFATPGMPNSHLHKISDGQQWIHIDPEVFSPDQDGHDDLLGVSIKTDCKDCQVSIKIFDAHGQLIRDMVNNLPIGNEQTWFWDGIKDNGKKADIGIYIIYTELYGMSQKRMVSRKICTVGG